MTRADPARPPRSRGHDDSAPASRAAGPRGARGRGAGGFRPWRARCVQVLAAGAAGSGRAGPQRRESCARAGVAPPGPSPGAPRRLPGLCAPSSHRQPLTCRPFTCRLLARPRHWPLCPGLSPAGVIFPKCCVCVCQVSVLHYHSHVFTAKGVQFSFFLPGRGGPPGENPPPSLPPPVSIPKIQSLGKTSFGTCSWAFPTSQVES